MDANRFYSIPYDARNDTAILKLRKKQGGIVAFGRWQALLGMLFDEGGVIDVNDPDDRKVIRDELELTEPRFVSFIETCISYGLLSLEMWELGRIGSKGVCEELEFRVRQREQKSSAGKKGAAAKKAKAEEDANSNGGGDDDEADA